MKRIFTLLVLATIFSSCNKETFKPTLESQKVSSYGENEIKLNFFVAIEDNFEGEMKFWIGNVLDTTIDLSQVTLTDTVFCEGCEPLKKGTVSLTCTNTELAQCGGWFHISIQFDDTISRVLNKNTVNGQITFYNNDTNFLEPAWEHRENVVQLNNSFWTKPKTIPTVAPRKKETM